MGVLFLQKNWARPGCGQYDRIAAPIGPDPVPLTELDVRTPDDIVKSVTVLALKFVM